jgi:hypothetical protein
MESFQVESFSSITPTSQNDMIGGNTEHIGKEMDFNKTFDSIVDSPQEDGQTPITINNRIKDSSLDEKENEVLEDYNHLQPGYTFQSPTMFRTPESQPPICLTDRPCQSQPVVISTSMGTEFLPYAKIKSSITIDDDKIKKNGSQSCTKSDPVLQT